MKRPSARDRLVAIASFVALAGSLGNSTACAVSQAEEPEEVAFDACSETAAERGTFTLFATAPQGIGSQHLGRPFDRYFEPIAGTDGSGIFPSAEVHTTPLGVMEHRYVSMEDSRSLDAHASGWGVSGSLATESTRRYMGYRA